MKVKWDTGWTFFNKVLLAIRDMQYKYLFSDYITPESQYLETQYYG